MKTDIANHRTPLRISYPPGEANFRLVEALDLPLDATPSIANIPEQVLRDLRAGFPAGMKVYTVPTPFERVLGPGTRREERREIHDQTGLDAIVVAIRCPSGAQ
ncbi:MAG: hypothetical protein WBC04_04115 [Candidatus Acidiferrales bacterium]